MNAPDAKPTFDEYAHQYETTLDQGLRLTGESRDYFAAQRVIFTKNECARRGARVRTILDFGCGTGDTIPLLRNAFDAEVIGTDPSAASRLIAETRFGIRSFSPSDLPSDVAVDVVYCNGVFHHIPLSERAAAMLVIAKTLRPGGLFFLWENNPLNPGTRWVMSRIPFDRDALCVWPSSARSLGVSNGFAVLRTSFHFYFPHSLRCLRRFERLLASIPLGGQYVVVFSKSG